MDKALFAPLKQCDLPIDTPSRHPTSFTRDGFSRLMRNKLAVAGLVILTLLMAGAILIPPLCHYPYFETHLALKNQPPSGQFWFGTDDLGRDLFSRVWCGARISLFIGFCAAFIDMFIGVLYGAIAGFFGKWIDSLLMRIADIFYSIPRLMVVILLMVVMEQGIHTIVLAMTLTGWINMARIIRAQVMQLKEQEFIFAAQAMGATRMRSIFYHLIPNTYGTIITTVTLTIPTAIFNEAFLSFLGLGVNAPMASLGTMASDGLHAFRYFPWRLFFPAGFISLTLLAFNLVGDGLRDAFDPRLRR